MGNHSVSESAAESVPAKEQGFGIYRALASVGPSFVYILTALGAGDIVSNATAGASYGYQLIWALGLTLIFRFIWVNISAKYVLVTGESLLAGYGRLGRWVPLSFLVTLVPIRHLANLYAILIIGTSADLLFPLPTQWSVAIWGGFFTFVGFSLTFWGGYSAVEFSCKVLVGLLGASLIVAAALSDPDPAAILAGTFIPHVPQAEGLYSAVLLLMALIGTEVGSHTNMNYAYFIYEKGWRNISYLKQQRFDLVVGVLAMFIMGALLQIAAAGVIHPLGIDVEDADDLARMFTETLGVVGRIIFGLGLWAAAFSTFVCGNTGGSLIFTDICRTFVSRLKTVDTKTESYSAVKDPLFRGILIFWAFSPLYILFSEVRPVWLVLMVNSFYVFLIPVLVVVLLIITNDGSLMGKHKNAWLTNLVMVTLVIFSLYFTYRHLMGLWENWGGH